MLLDDEPEHQERTEQDRDERERQQPVHLEHALARFLADFLDIFFVEREFPVEGVGDAYLRKDARAVGDVPHERLVVFVDDGEGDVLPALRDVPDLVKQAVAVGFVVDFRDDDLVSRKLGVAHLEQRDGPVGIVQDPVLGRKFVFQELGEQVLVLGEDVHVAQLVVEVRPQVPKGFALFLAQVFERKDVRERFFEEEPCRRNVFDVVALEELREDGQGVVFRLLVLLLLDEDFEVEEVNRARQVGMQVALQVGVLFQDAQQAERFVIVVALVGQSD